jgi:hypothetical protein
MRAQCSFALIPSRLCGRHSFVLLPFSNTLRLVIFAWKVGTVQVSFRTALLVIQKFSCFDPRDQGDFVLSISLLSMHWSQAVASTQECF